MQFNRRDAKVTKEERQDQLGIISPIQRTRDSEID
jgi:hypothetical protein